MIGSIPQLLSPASRDWEDKEPAISEGERRLRLRAIVIEHHALVWRSLRRFGAPERRVDEAVSRVFDVLDRKLVDIPVGKERPFLIAVCGNVGAEFRRAEKVRCSREGAVTELEMLPSPTLDPEEHLQEREARKLLDEALDDLDPQARTVLVLHELEQWTMAEIADCLDVPPGTVASRLRRGREQFAHAAERIRARLQSEGGKR